MLSITKSHPLLSWLRSSSIKTHRTPQHIASALSGLTTHKQARDLLEKHGLNCQPCERLSETAFAVYLTPPESPTEHNDISFYSGAQIVLPKTFCDIVPRGTVLMNCLLPKIHDRDQAARTFLQHQKAVLALCQGLEAFPFACITGHKNEDPQHDLFYRGFRFFWSSAPENLLERMQSVLKLYLLLEEENCEAATLRQAARDIQDLKFCLADNKLIGHSVLEDIKPMGSDTILVKLIDL
ncbi:MAG: hypothetical protein KKH83_07715 [Candidatus Margulisbacteria bacterium]|nr:hypothetical protein [Candidatus Margulisiibacteriota bacterium]